MLEIAENEKRTREREHWEQIKRPLWGNCDNYSVRQRKAGVNFKSLGQVKSSASASTANSDDPVHKHTLTHFVIQVLFQLSEALFTCLPCLTPHSSQRRGLPVRGTRTKAAPWRPKCTLQVCSACCQWLANISLIWPQRTTEAYDLFTAASPQRFICVRCVWVSMSSSY